MLLQYISLTFSGQIDIHTYTHIHTHTHTHRERERERERNSLLSSKNYWFLSIVNPNMHDVVCIYEHLFQNLLPTLESIMISAVSSSSKLQFAVNSYHFNKILKSCHVPFFNGPSRPLLCIYYYYYYYSNSSRHQTKIDYYVHCDS